MYDPVDILLTLVQGEDGIKWAESQFGWTSDSGNVCNWDGINCDPADGETIVGIKISSSDFTGTITSEIGKLTSLLEFSIPQNKVHGTIPQALANLPHLEKINLSDNELTGTFSTFKSPKIVTFNLSKNNLCGTLPSDIGMLHDLMVEFDVTGNKLQGTIPDSFRFMTALKALSLSTNEFSGTIPDSLGYCRVLSYLYLDHNFLMGTIPVNLAKLGPSVKELWLQENLLSGTVPAAVAELKNMFNFYVDGNKFTGTVPKELCRKELNDDFFKGVEKSERDYCESVACPMGFVAEDGIYPCHECPSKYFNPYLGGRIGHCVDMEQHDILHVLYNDMGGKHWKDISLEWNPENDYYCAYTGVTCDNNNNIIGINLKNKKLTGTIPEVIGFLRFLEHLDLSDNELTGYLPSDLRWTPLETLDISGNKLKGIVPPILCRQAGINGNGDGGKFDCGLIACPIGHYSPTGVSKLNEQCLSCDGDAPYLGSKVCSKSNGKYPSKHSVWGNTSSATKSGERSFETSTIAFISIIAGFALLLHAYRSYRRITREERARLYQDVLEDVEDVDMEERFEIS